VCCRWFRNVINGGERGEGVRLCLRYIIVGGEGGDGVG
jgi:hypothetical protein